MAKRNVDTKVLFSQDVDGMPGVKFEILLATTIGKDGEPSGTPKYVFTTRCGSVVNRQGSVSVTAAGWLTAAIAGGKVDFSLIGQ